jgi:3-oxoadipate enol-lactonase
MPHTLNRGCRLFWERDGNAGAPPLLLVRGLGRSSRFWGKARERLGESFHLVVTDNRGVGRSGATWPPYTTRLLADDQAAVLDAAGVERAHVFGISLGGMIAQQLAIRHPQRVDRLVLGCTTPGGPHAVRFPRGGVRDLLRAAVAPLDRAVRVTAPRALSAEALEKHPEIVDEWIAIARSEPRRRRGLLGQLFAAGRHDAWDDLPRISAPTLVVTGDADRLILADNSRRIAERIPRARLRILEGAGHDFPTERPDETAALLREFLLA